MAISLMKVGFRSAFLNMEKSAALAAPAVNSWQTKRVLHTKQDGCRDGFCLLGSSPPRLPAEQVAQRVELARHYSERRARGGRERRREQSDSDSDSGSDSDTQCKGIERSEFWRRKMRTVHNILDVNKDGLISFGDFMLLAKRFTDVGHLGPEQEKEFEDIMKLTWEEQWGAVDPYNFVTVEQYLEDMHHVLNDKALKKKAHRWLPYLFKAVDKDKSGYISVAEFKMFFECLGLNNEQAAVAFAVIDTNGDGKLSLKEFVKLGKDFFFSEDEKKVSKMFWGPLVGH